MGFNKEYFFKYGIQPAMKSLQDYIGYNMQKSLLLQRHLQTMAETGYQYDRRGQEQMRGFQYDKDLHDMNVNFAKLNDTMDRNRINIKANSDVWVAGQKAGISIQRTEAEEKIRLGTKKKSYEYMARALGNAWEKDPAKGEEISINSYVKSIDGLAKLGEMEENISTKIRFETGNISAIKADKELTEAEKDRQIKESRQKITHLQKRVEEIGAYRGGLNDHVGLYKQMGVTPKGVIPQEKQAYILQGLAALQKMNLPIDQMSGEELLGGLNRMLPGYEITPDDMDFILANALAFMKKIAK